MGILKQGILGGVKNKVGSVVGSSWKGIATLRALPLSVTNPRTAAQVANRNRFKSVSTIATTLLSSIIKPLNDRFAQQMSGFNLFMQRSKNCISTSGTFVPDQFILSRGKLGATTINAIAANSSFQTAEVSFSTDLTNAYQATTDKVYATLINSNGTVLGISSGTALRSSGAAEFVLLGQLVALDEVYAHLSFLRADGTQVGDTTFLQTQVIS